MDNIRKALDRAKQSRIADIQPQKQTGAALQQPQSRPTGSAQSSGNFVMLNSAHLESKRIISHDIADPRSKSFDMLRTQVLQSMDLKSWQFLGVTSPTAACGKTTISTNLALSISRQAERSVLLLDFDFQKPQVANSLGLKCNRGVLSLLAGRTDLASSLVKVRIRNQQFLVLPCETPTLHSSELMASRAMSALLQEIKQAFIGWTVIVDLPPLLTSDDVITILPQIDCVLFVAAVGVSTMADIKEANRYLDSSSVVRVVVNKAPDTSTTYYSYAYSRYANPPASEASTVP